MTHHVHAVLEALTVQELQLISKYRTNQSFLISVLCCPFFPLLAVASVLLKGEGRDRKEQTSFIDAVTDHDTASSQLFCSTPLGILFCCPHPATLERNGGSQMQPS